MNVVSVEAVDAEIRRLEIDLAGLCTGDGPCDATPTGTGTNWVTRAGKGTATGGLPAYVRALVHAFRRSGVPESVAVQRAIGVLKDWAAGKGKVTQATRARAAKAVAQWEALRAKARTTRDHSKEAPMAAIDLTDRAERARVLDLAMTAAMRKSAPTFPGTSKYPVKDQDSFNAAWMLRGRSSLPKAKVEAWLRGVAKRNGYKIPGETS